MVLNTVIYKTYTLSPRHSCCKPKLMLLKKKSESGGESVGESREREEGEWSGERRESGVESGGETWNLPK